MVPLATALAGPAAHAFGRTASLWGCATLVVWVTAAVLFVPDVRTLTWRKEAAVPSDAGDVAVGAGDVAVDVGDVAATAASADPDPGPGPGTDAVTRR